MQAVDRWHRHERNARQQDPERALYPVDWVACDRPNGAVEGDGEPKHRRQQASLEEEVTDGRRGEKAVADSVV